ncbi:tetratricopeptide repeat protein [Candidatus Poribacteria bacterium]|nr:tetratricopeptide repeat protein [Candidatus Poribacteria bacterium]
MKFSFILILIFAGAVGISVANPSDYERGQQALQRGDYELALQHFHLACQSQPDRVDSYTGLGYAYSQLGQYENAIQSYQQALRLDAWSSQAHLGLGYRLHCLPTGQI